MCICLTLHQFFHLVQRKESEAANRELKLREELSILLSKTDAKELQMAERERKLAAEKMAVQQDRQALEMRLAEVVAGDRLVNHGTGMRGRKFAAPSLPPHGPLRSSSVGRSSPTRLGGGSRSDSTLRDIGNTTAASNSTGQGATKSVSSGISGESVLASMGINLKAYHDDLNVISEEQAHVSICGINFTDVLFHF